MLFRSIENKESAKELLSKKMKLYDEIAIDDDDESDNIINIDSIKENETIKIAADTIDEFEEFEKEEPKIFFGLDDYGHFAKYTELEDMTRLQKQLNEIYKQKKNQEED